MRVVVALLLVLLQFTISVDVDVALFNLTVLDDHGKTVSGLTAENFRIYEDGREQKVKIFQPEDSPATVGLVIDNSGSMGNKRSDVVTAALAFVNASHPDDEIFVVDFNHQAWLALPESIPFTGDTTELRKALLATRVEGTTALYDALSLALDHLKHGTLQRKALVLISDGADNASTTNFDTVQRMAEQSSATIYCVGIYDPYDRDKNPGVLKKLAKLTGGEAFFPHQPSDLREIWPKIAGSIRGQYTIGYLSDDNTRDGAYRKVKITAVDKRGKPLEVRTRSGYLAGKP
jgi:Ca-activated chloride channel family protein